MGGVKSCFLGFCCLVLVFFPPLVISHTIQIGACLIFADIQIAFLTGFLNPAGQAVPAEPRQIHHINFLHICSGLRMVPQGPERGGLQLKFCLRIKVIQRGHGLSPLVAAGQKRACQDCRMTVIPFKAVNTSA